MSSSSFEQGDIIVAVLPFSDQNGMKRRPALVMSGTKYNKSSSDIVLLPITSKKNAGRYIANLSGGDVVEGHLKVESQIKAGSPVSFYTELVEGKIGKISARKLAEVKKITSELYDL